jgi:hypothetical protein
MSASGTKRTSEADGRVERIDIVGKPQRKLSNSLRQFASLPVELIAPQ